MSAINQSPDFALAPQKADDPLAVKPELTESVAIEQDKTEAELDQNSGKENQKNQIDNKQLDHEQLEKVAQQLQDFMGEMNRSLQFQVDEDSGRDVIKVIDKSSGDVIKQYPSEEVLSLVAKLSETTGMLVDQTV